MNLFAPVRAVECRVEACYMSDQPVGGLAFAARHPRMLACQVPPVFVHAKKKHSAFACGVVRIVMEKLGAVCEGVDEHEVVVRVDGQIPRRARFRAVGQSLEEMPRGIVLQHETLVARQGARVVNGR